MAAEIDGRFVYIILCAYDVSKKMLVYVNCLISYTDL